MDVNGKMWIGLDFDGVFTDCGQMKTRAAKELYGLDIPAAKMKREVLTREGIMTAEQYRALQKHIYYDPKQITEMTPVPGVLEYVRDLQKNHDVEIVTARDWESTDLARQWLERYDLDIKITGTGNRSKASACKGMDIFVDDDLDKLEQLEGIVQKRFLFGWDYNKDVKLPSNIERIDNWPELSRKIGISNYFY